MIQVSLVMTLLYLAYKWLLANTTFHRLNRVAILAIYVVSWFLPMSLPLFSGPAAEEGTVSVGLPIIVTIADSAPVLAEQFDWWDALVWLYLAGESVVAVATVAGVVRMVSVIGSGRKFRCGGYIEVVTSHAPGPFSWGRYIVVRPSDLDGSHEMVVAHESAHLRLMHWLDLVPAQLTAIVQWFSPAAWLLMRELKDVHEFKVDEMVGGDDPAEYQMMLIRKTVGSGLPIFADSLNHSLIKKRITMMMTKKSSPSRRVAALALPAVAALAVLTLSQPVVADVTNRISTVTLGDDSNGKINEKTVAVQTVGKIHSVTDVDGASASVASGLPEELVAAEIAVETGAETEAVPAASSENKDAKPVYFVDGKLYTGDLNSMDPSYIESIRVVKNDPEYPQGKIMITTKTTPAPRQSEDGVYRTPQKIADYKGGMTALKNLLSEMVKYPENSGNSDIPVTVRVIVQFVIGTDGTVSDEKIVKSGGEAFDAEALRVVRATNGQWIPAENDGKPVPSMFTIPITFKKK